MRGASFVWREGGYFSSISRDQVEPISGPVCEQSYSPPDINLVRKVGTWHDSLLVKTLVVIDQNTSLTAKEVRLSLQNFSYATLNHRTSITCNTRP